MTPERGEGRPRILDLKDGRQMLYDEADEGLISSFTVYLGTNGYAYHSVWEDGKSTPYTVHRTLIEAPKGSHVDHINGNKLDNRRGNLRVVPPQRNQVNRKNLNRNNGSGVRGVTVRTGARNPYIAQIMVDGKVHYLGSHSTLEAAAAARRAAELEHWGELCP